MIQIAFNDVKCILCGQAGDFFVSVLKWNDGVCEQCQKLIKDDERRKAQD